MKLGFQLQVQQTQKLIMTPELRQAIAVLQLPVTELEEFIENELLENPCLEAEPRDEPEARSEPSIEARKLLEYLGGDYSGYGVVTRSGEDEPTFESYRTSELTLHDHLRAQLYLSGLDDEGQRIGEFLIGSLDDHGYLTLTTEDAALYAGIPPGRLDQVLQVVQGFDPVGVGARSLRECLLLQWETIDDGNPLVRRLICDFLGDLGEGRGLRVAEELGATPLELQEAVDLIRLLDPKPGRRFGRPNDTRYVVPDVVVERVGSEYVVIVNEGPVPRLGISGQYRQMLAGSMEADARKYVEDKIHSALWMMKAIEQRRLTLFKVMESILSFQRDFFDHGIRHLRPLTLKDVGNVVGVHESTVSRATSGKYVQTPRGTFDLKFFFSSGVDGAQGSGVAQESVKRLISDLISREDLTEPLSDQSLTERLTQQGMQISRRTVAKYREEMGVPSSNRRKRYK